MEEGGHRQIERPKVRWSDVIRKYLKEKQVKIEEASDRITSMYKTRCVDRREKAEKEKDNII